jgi:hypothetical protein
MKITPSAMVNTLSGKTGGIVAAHWKGRPYVRKLVIPTNPKSAAQTLVRNSMAKMAAMFRSLIAVAQAWDKTYGSKLSMTAFNVFTKHSRKAYQAGTAMAPVPPNPLCVPLGTLAAAAGSGAAGTLVVTWAATVVTGFTNVVLMAIKHTGGLVFESASSNVLQTALTATLTGLTPATSYDVYAFLYNPTSGNMGTSGMATGTSHA